MGTCTRKPDPLRSDQRDCQTALEVSIEGSRTLISHLPSALIIHQSVLTSHPTRRCQVCAKLSFAKEGNLRPIHRSSHLDVLLMELKLDHIVRRQIKNSTL